MSKDKLLYGLIVLAFVVGFGGGIMVGARMESSNLARFTHVDKTPTWEMFDSKTGQSCISASPEVIRGLVDPEGEKYRTALWDSIRRGEQPPDAPHEPIQQFSGPPRIGGMPYCTELIKGAKMKP